MCYYNFELFTDCALCSTSQYNAELSIIYNDRSVKPNVLPDKWTVFVLLEDHKHKVEIDVLDDKYLVNTFTSICCNDILGNNILSLICQLYVLVLFEF